MFHLLKKMLTFLFSTLVCADYCSSLYVDFPSFIFVLKKDFFLTTKQDAESPHCGKNKEQSSVLPDFPFHDVGVTQRESPAIKTPKHLFFTFLPIF